MSYPQFKARPSTVVHKKPFVPKKVEHPIIVENFLLSTEQRAKEREEFDKKLKEKESQLELMKKEV